MVLKRQSIVAVLGSALLLWQAGLAPLAHAAAGHTSALAVALPAIPEVEVGAGVEAMPCHGHEASGTGVVPDPDAHAAAHGLALTAGAASHSSGGADCCQSLDCQCPCAHASMTTLALSVAARVSADHPLLLGRDLPILRARAVELFKPPI